MAVAATEEHYAVAWSAGRTRLVWVEPGAQAAFAEAAVPPPPEHHVDDGEVRLSASATEAVLRHRIVGPRERPSTWFSHFAAASLESHRSRNGGGDDDPHSVSCEDMTLHCAGTECVRLAEPWGQVFTRIGQSHPGEFVPLTEGRRLLMFSAVQTAHPVGRTDLEVREYDPADGALLDRRPVPAEFATAEMLVNAFPAVAGPVLVFSFQLPESDEYRVRLLHLDRELRPLWNLVFESPYFPARQTLARVVQGPETLVLWTAPGVDPRILQIDAQGAEFGPLLPLSVPRGTVGPGWAQGDRFGLFQITPGGAFRCDYRLDDAGGCRPVPPLPISRIESVTAAEGRVAVAGLGQIHVLDDVDDTWLGDGSVFRKGDRVRFTQARTLSDPTRFLFVGSGRVVLLDRDGELISDSRTDALAGSDGALLVTDERIITSNWFTHGFWFGACR